MWVRVRVRVGDKKSGRLGLGKVTCIVEWSL